MKWIVFENVGEIPEHGIRLLGLSTKNPNQIGQFGTGLKEAVALLLRRNKALVITSGTNRVDFKIIERAGLKEIAFYWNGEERLMNLSPEFGHKDWNDLWQAFREVSCNAIDEGDYNFTMENEICGEAGRTKVYVQSDPETLVSFASLSDRLLQLGSRITCSVNVEGRIISKSSDNGTDIFHKGVWIQRNHHLGYYDYEIKNLRLTESRTSSDSDIYEGVGRIIGNCTDPEVIMEILKSFTDPKSFESKIYYWSFSSRARSHADIWKKCFFKVFGPKAVICPADVFLNSHVVAAGYKPVDFHNLKSALHDLGLPDYTDVLTQDTLEKIEIVPDKDSYCAIPLWSQLEAAKIVTKPRPEVLVFKKDETAEGGQVFGFVRNGIVHVNECVLGSDEERITLMEEFAHYESEMPDNSRGFQSWLCKAVLKGLRHGSATAAND